MSSLEKGQTQRALLDGGATHALRMPRSQTEYDDAVPIRVELASGETVLRQVVETGTLLTDVPTQTIVPLGKLMVLGYAVDWNSEGFHLRTPNGQEVDTHLDGGCPTVSLEVGLKLIEELEEMAIEDEKRMKVLRGEDVKGVDGRVLRWLQELKALFPQVPDDLLVRVPPRRRGTSEDLPWNRRLRRTFQGADALVMHLFSGPDQSFWKRKMAEHGLTALTLDKSASRPRPSTR